VEAVVQVPEMADMMRGALGETDVQRQLASRSQAVAGDHRATAAELRKSRHRAFPHRSFGRGERRARQVDDLVIRVELRVVIGFRDAGFLVGLLCATREAAFFAGADFAFAAGFLGARTLAAASSALAATALATLGETPFVAARGSVRFGSRASGGPDRGGDASAAARLACGLVVPGGACSFALGRAASSSCVAASASAARSSSASG